MVALPQQNKQQKAASTADTDADRPQIEPIKRQKTRGEKFFNLGVYGGITWVLNEVISTWAMNKIRPAEDGAKAGAWHNSFHNTVEKAHNAVSHTPIKKSWVERALMITYACIGGTLVLPLIKGAEDHKSPWVRKLDRLIEGKKADTDPAIIQAHEEMDQAPPQTWMSLIKGRLVVMGLAIGLDFASGGENAPTTKLLESTPLRSVSNMERSGRTIARATMAFLHPSKEKRDIIYEQLRKEPHAKITAAEGPAMKTIGMGGFLFILSGALTVLFYVSSKLFAFKSEMHKVEKKMEAGTLPTHHKLPVADQAPQPEAANTAQPEHAAPLTQVHASHSKIEPMLDTMLQPSMQGRA